METTLSTQGNRVETSFIYITYRGVGKSNSKHNWVTRIWLTIFGILFLVYSIFRGMSN